MCAVAWQPHTPQPPSDWDDTTLDYRCLKGRCQIAGAPEIDVHHAAGRIKKQAPERAFRRLRPDTSHSHQVCPKLHRSWFTDRLDNGHTNPLPGGPCTRMTILPALAVFPGECFYSWDPAWPSGQWPARCGRDPQSRPKNRFAYLDGSLLSDSPRLCVLTDHRQGDLWDNLLSTLPRGHGFYITSD